MTRKRKAAKVQKEPKKARHYVDVEPDPEDENFMFDDTDQYNNDRVKMLLGNTMERKKRGPVEVEVFPVGDDDSDEDDAIVKMEQEEKRIRRQTASKVMSVLGEDKVKQVTEDVKPTDVVWGKKRSAYYGGEGGDDGGIDFSGSEEDDAVLEEKEALVSQKKQLEVLDESDFNLSQYVTEKKTAAESVEVVATDLSKLTPKEMKEMVKRESPELVPILKDAIKRCKEAQKVLCPIVGAYMKRQLPEHSLFAYLQNKLTLYANHFANIAFYRYLKLQKEDTRGHPVVETIFSFIELFKKYKSFDGLVDPLLQVILKKLKNGRSELVTLEELETVFGGESDTDFQDDLQEGLSGDDEDGDYAECSGEVEAGGADDGDDDRTVDYKIEKNKGLTAKRKKELKNPRVRYRMKYRRALIRRRGQVRPHRTQMQPYAGELSGIRAGIKRGIRLKA